MFHFNLRRAGRIWAAFLFVGLVPGVGELAQAEQSLGDKIKKILAPTPTPPPRKHRKSSTAAKKKEDAERSPTPKPQPSPEKSPSPAKKRKSKATDDSTAAEESTPQTKTSSKKKHRSAPTPSPAESATPSQTPESNEPSSSPTPTAATTKKKGAPATIEASQIVGYQDYPANVQKILDASLDLTKRNLDYTYGSADPGNGGMDCSGFIYYVLTHNNVQNVPRDSAQQYLWVRKTGIFKAVNSRHEDTFELDELVPGDLLFWTGTYSVERDPPITHVMIYLGREKGTNQRIMVGASDGRTYKGESRYGVSVFDFKMPRPSKTAEGRVSPSFIGYGHIPGLKQ